MLPVRAHNSNVAKGFIPNSTVLYFKRCCGYFYPEEHFSTFQNRKFNFYQRKGHFT